MKNQLCFNEVKKTSLNEMLVLIKQLNPDKDGEVLKHRLEIMLDSNEYRCFGLYIKNILVGLIGCWTSTRLYSGKQLELDNVIIDNTIQSKGYGKLFFNFVEDWAMKNGYKTIELKTYVENSRSHKFYFNQDFKMLGFHFQKQLTTT